MRGFYGVVDLGGAGGATSEAEADLVARGRALAEQLIRGGARVVQVRMKRAGGRALLAVSRAVREVTSAAGVAFVVNDRVDVALAAGADGVHLGQDDLPIAAARAVIAAVGRGGMAIGISTHSTAQARAAAREGADYLGFGPVYATATKENPDPVQGPAALAEAVREVSPVPVVAIGGITIARVPEIVQAGAAAACVISAVNGSPDVVAAARAVSRAFASRS